MDKETLNSYTQAGKIASSALKLGESLIKKQAPITKILDEVEQHILSKGAFPAFPAQISLNNVAAHQCSTDPDELIPEGIIKLDVGAHVNGFIGDNALSVAIDADDSIIKASRKALNNALKIAKPGVFVRDIGKEIQTTIEDLGFKPVKNLSGHGLGNYQIHKSPSIPNYHSLNTEKLNEGDVIAIEPFASTSTGIVSSAGNATVFNLTSLKPVRSNFTREVLKKIKSYKGLPFTSRWLIKEFGEGKTNFALRELKNNNMILEHPPLADDDGFVSQSEHTIIIKDKPIITTKCQE
ncbi:MAG: type II methionyl aminopeptidase [Candidatus Woesearchaeota archaeon]